jgi:hypothetical protein
MKRFSDLFIVMLMMSVIFVACAPTEEDTCSSELGDVGPDYGCSVAVYPQICTVNGVDDHYILNGVDYPCPNGNCSTIPPDLITAINNIEGCGSKKSIDLDAANVKISKEAQAILSRLKMDVILCNN